MSIPTFKYPYVIQCQQNKKGRWSSRYSIREDMGFEYALDSLNKDKMRTPEDNFRLIRLEIIE